MDRPSLESIYMSLAVRLAERSTCSRMKVGTVITSVDYRRVLSIGYNGNASGLPNCCDYLDRPGGCGCLHSEENAVINCDSPRSIEKVVFVTHLPCWMCAKRLINLGSVVRIYYREEYRTQDALQILLSAGIPITKTRNDDDA